MTVGQPVQIGQRTGLVLSKRDGGYRVRFCSIDHKGRAVITYLIVREEEK